MMQQEAPIMIKQGSLDKGKKAAAARANNINNKGPTRDEVSIISVRFVIPRMSHAILKPYRFARILKGQ